VDPGTSMDCRERRKILPLQVFELRPVGRPARSQSLYRLRYPGSLKEKGKEKGKAIPVTVSGGS
jgi:hypothetical protein